MDPFTKQGNCPRTLIRKSPYTKAGPRLRIRVPRFDITGNLSEPSLPRPIHYSTKLCFNLSLDNRDLFRITMQCLNPLTQWNCFPTVQSLYSTIQCLQPVHDSRYLR
ncbi:hypothetical protein TNCT_237171 [Trichonephila clavata]|uniref:Uncharacterized protein n=1 Tax=Trichonephila clavata TaxID=2740835 RepID=A0A8X6JXL7_TRICU|nr:hypothetical protein TNCT_237171 [Trichonephila clavata]